MAPHAGSVFSFSMLVISIETSESWIQRLIKRQNCKDTIVVKYLSYITNISLKHSNGDRADKVMVLYRNVQTLISYSI